MVLLIDKMKYLSVLSLNTSRQLFKIIFVEDWHAEFSLSLEPLMH